MKNDVQISKKVFSVKKTYFVILLILILVQSLFSVGQSIVSQILIDDILPAKDYDVLWKGILIFGLICSLGIFGYYFKYILVYSARTHLETQIRKKIMQKYNSLTGKSAQQISQAELTTMLLEDVRDVSLGKTISISSIVTSFIVIVLTLFAMFYYSWIISLSLVGIFVIYYLLNIFLNKKLSSFQRKEKQAIEGLNKGSKQIYDSFIVNKMYSSPDLNVIQRNCLDSFTKYQNRSMKYNSFRFFIYAFNMLITTLITVLIYGVGGIFMIQNTMTLGFAIGIGLLFQSLSSPISSIADGYSDVQKSRNAMERIEKYLSLEDEDKKTDIVLEKISKIEFDNVSFRYTNVDVINNLSFQMNKASVYFLMGSSGKGKSTIVKLLLGLLTPVEGQVLINEKNCIDYNVTEIRNRIGYLSQEGDLITGISLLDNVTLGLPYSQERLEFYSKMLKLDDLVNDLECGWNTMINDKVNISGGQKQRMCILRTLLQERDMYIFDEPETGLSTDLIQVVYELFKKLSSEKIILIITHNKNAKEYFSKEEYTTIELE